MSIFNNYKGYILSVSYGNYMTSIGGTDKVIFQHQVMYNHLGLNYIYLYPSGGNQNGNKVRSSKWKIIVNGEVLVYDFETTGINKVISNLLKIDSEPNEVHIHHILNLEISELRKTIEYYNCSIRFYIHDFYTVCINMNLLRNNKTFCGMTEPSLGKCFYCRYYYRSRNHFEIVSNLISSIKNRTTFIFPSNNAMSNWLKVYKSYSMNAKVIEHQVLKVDTYLVKKIKTSKKLRIAYVGANSNSKGWSVWQNLFAKLPKNDKYNFYVLGGAKSIQEYYKVINVKYSLSNFNAMQDALIDNDISVAILWSIWPETYSFTYYECLSAGVYVITNTFSGNIADQVEIRRNGIVLNSEFELISLLKNADELITRVDNYKNSSYYKKYILELNRL